MTAYEKFEIVLQLAGNLAFLSLLLEAAWPTPKRRARRSAR